MGEDVELEVVVGERELLEALQRLLQRRGRVDARKAEGGHAAQRDLGDDPERAEPHAGGAKQLGVLPAEHSSVEPSASTSVSAATCEGMLRSRAPVPWVAVEIAPAMLCASMSPRFSMARPCSARRWLSARIVMPPCTRTSPQARSTSSTRSMRSSLRRTPVGESDVAEGVPRADDAHALALRRGALQRRGELRDRGGPLDRRGRQR